MALQRNNSLSLALLAILLLGAAVAFMAMPPLLNPMAEAGRAAIKAIPPVIITEHADLKHPKDAPLIRQCLKNQGGAYEVWYRKSDKNYFLVCQLPDLRWGFQIIVRGADKVWHETTAFVRGGGTYKEMTEYFGSAITRIDTPPWLLP